ncbi:hypothetical protein CSUI_009242, partial [Cystoisospora suis]
MEAEGEEKGSVGEETKEGADKREGEDVGEKDMEKTSTDGAVAAKASVGEEGKDGEGEPVGDAREDSGEREAKAGQPVGGKVLPGLKG